MEERISGVFQQMATRSKSLIEVKIRWNAESKKLRISWTNVTPDENEFLQIKLLQTGLEKMSERRVYFTSYLRGRWIEFHFDRGGEDIDRLMNHLCSRIDSSLYYNLS